MDEAEGCDESIHDLNVAMYNPDEMEQQSKRRKSRFDTALPPAPVNVDVQLSNVPVQQYESLQVAFDSKTGQFLEYSSVVDRMFRHRLDDSLQKNLLYLDKLDNQHRQQELGNVSEATNTSKKTPSKFRQFFENKRVKAPKNGIGSEVAGVIDQQPKVQPNTKVYVNHLPLDITEEEIGILFSPQGKIKKIKLYKDNQGNKKGDALVAFASADSALLACRKLDKLDIGDGHIISVSLAEYKGSASTNLHFFELSNRCIPADFRDSFHYSLPEAIKSMVSSKVVISNCYDQTATEELLSSLEIEMMITACSYGDIDVIERAIAPSSSSDISNNHDTMKSIFGEGGCFIIAFREDRVAEACATAMHGSMFNGRKVAAHWISKFPVIQQAEELLTTDDVNKSLNIMMETASDAALVVPVDEESIRKEAEDVEDFLNSLL